MSEPEPEPCIRPEEWVGARIPITIVGVVLLIPGLVTAVLLMPDGNPVGVVFTLLSLVCLIMGGLCWFWVLNGESCKCGNKKKNAVSPELAEVTVSEDPGPLTPRPSQSFRKAPAQSPTQPRRAPTAPPTEGPAPSTNLPPLPDEQPPSYEDYMNYPTPRANPPQNPAYPPPPR